MTSPDWVFPLGFQQWGDLTTGDYRWLLSTGAWVPSYADAYVADTAAGEITDGSYSRQTLTGGGSSVVGGQQFFSADAPSWTSLAGGDTSAWLVLAAWVTNDADSILMAAWRLGHTNDGTTFTPVLHSSGLVVFQQAA